MQLKCIKLMGLFFPSNSDTLLKISLFVDNQRELCSCPGS